MTREKEGVVSGDGEPKTFEWRRVRAMKVQDQMAQLLERDNPSLRADVRPLVLPKPQGFNWTYEMVVWHMLGFEPSCGEDERVVGETAESRWVRAVKMAQSPIVQAYSRTVMAADKGENEVICGVARGVLTEGDEEKRLAEMVAVSDLMESLVTERFEIWYEGLKKWARRVELLTDEELALKVSQWGRESRGRQHLKEANERRRRNPKPVKWNDDLVREIRDMVLAGKGYKEIAEVLGMRGVETNPHALQILISERRKKGGDILNVREFRQHTLKEFDRLARKVVREQGDHPTLEATLSALEVAGYDMDWAANRLANIGLRAERVRWGDVGNNELSLDDLLDSAYISRSPEENYRRFLNLLEQGEYDGIVPTRDAVEARIRRRRKAERKPLQP